LILLIQLLAAKPNKSIIIIRIRFCTDSKVVGCLEDHSLFSTVSLQGLP